MSDLTRGPSTFDLAEEAGNALQDAMTALEGMIVRNQHDDAEVSADDIEKVIGKVAEALDALGKAV